MSNVQKQHERTHTGKKSFTGSACKKTLVVERDHSAAQNVISHSQHQMLSSNMREHVLVRNHLTAQSATRHLHHQMVCYIMKELVVERDRLVVQNVKSHS